MGSGGGVTKSQKSDEGMAGEVSFALSKAKHSYSLACQISFDLSNFSIAIAYVTGLIMGIMEE